MGCTLDAVLYGREKSGQAFREDFPGAYAEHAGVKIGPSAERRLCAGVFSGKSGADDVIYGHDIDKSGAYPRDEFVQSRQFQGAAGLAVPEGRARRPLRRYIGADYAVMDDVLYGRDIDKSGEKPHMAMADRFRGSAGLKTGEIGPSEDLIPKRGGVVKALGLAASIDDVIQGRDVDASGPSKQVSHFVGLQKTGYAGVVAGAPHQFSGKVTYPLPAANQNGKCKCVSGNEAGQAPPKQPSGFASGVFEGQNMRRSASEGVLCRPSRSSSSSVARPSSRTSELKHPKAFHHYPSGRVSDSGALRTAHSGSCSRVTASSARPSTARWSRDAATSRRSHSVSEIGVDARGRVAECLAPPAAARSSAPPLTARSSSEMPMTARTFSSRYDVSVDRSRSWTTNSNTLRSAGTCYSARSASQPGGRR